MSTNSVSAFTMQSQENELLSIPYYHPNLQNMDEVRGVMVQYLMQDGCFLIRNSISKPGILTVTVMHTNSIKHFNIGTTNSSYYLQDKHFSTISELIRFYRNHDVPNVEGVEHVRLVRPIPYVNENTQRSPEGIGRSMSELFPQRPVAQTLQRQNVSHDARLNNIVEIPADLSPRNGAVSELTLPDPNQPGLPIAPPRKKNNSFTKLFKRDKKSSSGSESDRKLTSIDDRPPMPIPDGAASLLDDKTYRQFYDTVRNTDLDQTPELIYHLKKSERIGERCECGLTLEESELPMEWSMHISHEEPTQGRIFFMGPNDQTTWQLPFEVTLQLNQAQQDRIKTLIHDYIRNSGSGSTIRNPNSGSGSGNSQRSSVPLDIGRRNGQISGNSLGVDVQRRGRSMVNMQDTGPGSLNSMNRQPQQHECHVVEDEVFH